MLQKIGFTELVLVLIIAFLIFGPSKLPALGKSIGEGIKEFKNAFKAVGEDNKESDSKPKE